MAERFDHPPIIRTPDPTAVRPGHCQGCNTDLSREVVGGSCPLCERPIRGVCNGCGYQLQGLSVSAVCPECGQAVAASIRGDLLVFASPAHVATLHRGAKLILVSLLLGLFVMVAGTFRFMPTGSSAGVTMRIAAWARVACDAAWISLFVWGWYRLSTPDPSAASFDTGDQARQGLRMITVISAISMVGLSVIRELLSGRGQLPAAARMPIVPGNLSWFFCGGLLLWAAQSHLAMRYLGWLAHRMSRPTLVRRAASNSWELPVLLGPGLLLCGLGPLIAMARYISFMIRMSGELRSVMIAQGGHRS